MTVEKVVENVWRISAGSNVYFLDFKEKILIDTGERKEHADLKLFLTKLVDLEKVDRVIFTHLHYDHIGNFDMFPNARLFASQTAIDSFEDDPFAAVLKEDMAEKFKKAQLFTVEDTDDLKIMETPGHTKGSICIWYEKERVLFSGDTMLKKGLGRTDLPTSEPNEMKKTVMKLLQLNHKILCPGHEY